MASAQLPDTYSPEAADWLRGRLRWEHTLGRLRSPEAPDLALQVVERERELDQAA